MGTQDIENLSDKILALEFQLERLQWRFRCPKCGHGNRSSAIGDLKPREAIISFLKQYDRPVGVGLLKKQLAVGGYPMERFGPRHKYFYTLIGRLCESGIAMKDGDEVMLKG